MATLAIFAGLAGAEYAQADPCGMVPPVWIPTVSDGEPPVLQRDGEQITYAFFKDGIETMVLRPGFKGSVDEFGMLIPFPSAPAIRKTADDTFRHLDAAVDTPVVNVEVYQQEWYLRSMAGGAELMSAPVEASAADEDDGLAYDEVRVLNQEAVGMYEVAVLEAGSSKALNTWMEEHEFQYPEGMDKVVDDYVSDSWVFVAIKAQVGAMPGVAPQPGMTGLDATLPAGASFDGNVQGMGFRFRTEAPVIPMRMAAFNDADAHNLVYFLSDEPLKISGMSDDLVVRQVPGQEVRRNFTDLLPLNVTNGSLNKAQLDGIKSQRDPSIYNGVAKELVASDILAARTGTLALPFEEYEKELLKVSESLGLRGPEIDAVHHEVVVDKQDGALADALDELDTMTLTVFEGDFDDKYLAKQNVTFEPYQMAKADNTSDSWTRRPAGPWLYVEQGGGWWGGNGGGWFPW